jgi:hypothetical protein
LVLLYLPDHETTVVAHRLEVDRLVYLADVIVWVMDPQKYADAAIHDRLLRPNVQHAAVMVAVVNHMDEVPEEGRDRLYRDARRLLDDDGLSSVPLIATSARVGTGLDELRSVLASRIADKAASRTRVSADVDVAAQRLSNELGAVPQADALPALRDRLITSIAEVGRGTDGAQAPVLPEAIRNVVRSEIRTFTAGAHPAVAATVSTRGVAEAETLVDALRRPEARTSSDAPERAGVSRALKVLFFLLFLAGAGWLAAAIVKDIPNVIAAGALTAVGLVAWLLSMTLRRGAPSAKPVRGDLETRISYAVDSTVMQAVRAEVEAYEKAAADLKAAVTH